jgi:hypothetical protein
MIVADLLRFAIERNSSGLHVSPGNVPFISVGGGSLKAATKAWARSIRPGSGWF